MVAERSKVHSFSSSQDQKSSKDVCDECGIEHMAMDYTENDFVNLSTFKLYSQHVRPLINSRYPKLPTQKVMTLMAAYWREFLELKGAQHSSGVTSSRDRKSVV